MYLDLSKLHFTVRNWKIHIFHKFVKLNVVSWYLQHLKRGFCFCQDFVWCLCKKGNCQLFFSDWKGGPTSPELQEPHSVSSFLEPSYLKKIRKKDIKIYTFSLIGSFEAQAVRMYSGCNNFLRFSRIFMVSTHFVLYYI